MLERAKKRLETQLKELSNNKRKDPGLTFEELGVDRLFVDEAHCFKNLFYVTKMTRIAGLPQTASQRALDMFLKVSHVQRQNGGGGVVFATGTPIANSVAEMFTMQRYLQMAALKTLGIAHASNVWGARRLALSHLSASGSFDESIASATVQAIADFCARGCSPKIESLIFAGCCIEPRHLSGINVSNRERTFGSAASETWTHLSWE